MTVKQATRAEVYAAIDSERDYQEDRWNTETTKSGGVHRPGAFVTFMADYVAEARHVISRNGDPEATDQAMHVVRKVAALAVACLEQNGTIDRGDDEVIIEPSRDRIYDSIDAEREYQDRERPNSFLLESGEWIGCLEEYVLKARTVWVRDQSRLHAETLDAIRKIAGIGVHCMEWYGAPARVTSVYNTKERPDGLLTF